MAPAYKCVIYHIIIIYSRSGQPVISSMPTYSIPVNDHMTSITHRTRLTNPKLPDAELRRRSETSKDDAKAAALDSVCRYATGCHGKVEFTECSYTSRIYWTRASNCKTQEDPVEEAIPKWLRSAFHAWDLTAKSNNVY